MTNSAQFIPLTQLFFILIPVIIVGFIFFRWSKDHQLIWYATLRMIAQLITVGYVLVWIFDQSNAAVSSLVLCVMILASAWIALRPVREKRQAYYGFTLLSLLLGALPVLLLVILAVVQLEPWFEPRYLIPLAGMIFANSMNAISLCIDRLLSEMEAGKSFEDARAIAFRTALLPLMNSFFAVGLVSLPGMMTGQILSGVSPLLAVRYQIMVMCMLLGSAGITSAIFLMFIKRKL